MKSLTGSTVENCKNLPKTTAAISKYVRMAEFLYVSSKWMLFDINLTS